jgi:tetratricopeptide (TPR) repeat protein
VFRQCFIALTVSLVVCGSVRVEARNDQDDITSTITRFKTATEANPNNPVTRKGLGNAYLMAGKLEEAMEQFRQTIKLKSDDGEAYIGLARAQMRRNKMKDAAQTLRDGIKMGQVYSRLDQSDNSIAEFKQSIKLDGSNAVAHRDLGASLGMKGDIPGELAEEKKALELKPDDADALYYIGNAYAMQGDVPNAAKSLEKCVRLDPKNGDALKLLAGVKAADHKFPEAIKLAEDACKLNPDDKDAKLTLSKIKDAAEGKK